MKPVDAKKARDLVLVVVDCARKNVRPSFYRNGSSASGYRRMRFSDEKENGRRFVV